jgi:hypothetical protein
MIKVEQLAAGAILMPSSAGLVNIIMTKCTLRTAEVGFAFTARNIKI